MKKLNTKQQSGNAGEPHIVVLGGGFGGLEFCRRMKEAAVHISGMDRLPQRGNGTGAGAGERWAPGANLGTTDSLAAK